MPVLNGEKKSSGSENTDSQPPKDELGCSAGDFACTAAEVGLGRSSSEEVRRFGRCH